MTDEPIDCDGCVCGCPLCSHVCGEDESPGEAIERLKRELEASQPWNQPGSDPLADIRRYQELSRLQAFTPIVKEV